MAVQGEMSVNPSQPAAQFLVKSLDWAMKLLGSITSRCSRKEPALLPRTHGWTREDSLVSLNQSDICPQIFVGHKLSQQF